jgi:hypothetical protein
VTLTSASESQRGGGRGGEALVREERRDGGDGWQSDAEPVVQNSADSVGREFYNLVTMETHED